MSVHRVASTAAAEEPCIPSRAVMEARCLPVCLRLIINSLTQSSSDFLCLALLSDSLLWEALWRNGVSVLCTSRSVWRVRLTNWIPHMNFFLFEGGGEGWEGREEIPPCSLNRLHDTSDLFLRPPPTSALGMQEWWREGDSHVEKKYKSVQINNLKWHSKRCSASPFSVTVSCHHTGSLYISIHKLVPGETLWSWWLFVSAGEEVRGMYATPGYYRKRQRCGDWSVQVMTSNL